MGSGRQTSARLLAPLGLGAALIVLIVVVASSGGGGGGGSSPTVPPPPTITTTTPPASQGAAGSSGSYVVKPGDTLVGISRKTGVSVATLQNLNPDLDPQALAAGQRLKLSR